MPNDGEGSQSFPGCVESQGFQPELRNLRSFGVLRRLARRARGFGSLRMTTTPMETITNVRVAAYQIPTASPESDGTAEWDSTTLVAVHAEAGGVTGFGYTYADVSTATLIDDRLKDIVIGRDPFAIDAAWAAMIRSVRNLGRRGIAAMAISAVDNALWDLKAKLLGVPLVTLLGSVRDEAPVYGSGGFTSYSIDELRRQLGGWVADGIPRVKMKIGRDARADLERVAASVTPSFSSMRMVRIRGNSRWNRRKSFRHTMSAGSRSRCRRTISRVCACFATARRRAWKLRRESTATRSCTSIR